MAHLTWGLVIATKDRLEPLKTAVTLALGQTRPPAEVVVVDSSADWAAHQTQIGQIMATCPTVRFVYVQGEAPSITVQRNQAITHAQADIAFMIDDDSFMHPDCAAQIMAIYDTDLTGDIAGIQATETAEIPDVSVTGAQKQNVDISKARNASPILRWIFRKVFLMGMTEVFVPYDGHYHTAPLPASLQAQAVAPSALFGGFRMTYRRDHVVKTPFDPSLRYYCPGEDLDASYRMSRHGILLQALDAKLHHYASASGRLNRGQVAHLWSLNQAVLIRRHAPDQSWAQRAYRRKMYHRLCADIAKDILMRRFDLPQARGSWRAWRDSTQVFKMTPDALATWYPQEQERIVKG